MRLLKQGKTKEIFSWIVSLSVGLVIAFLVKTFVFTISWIPSPSMEPTLMVNDRVVCIGTYFSAPLKRGDIIVFRPNQKDYKDEYWVKRLIGLPGDHIEIKEGVVYVNGKMLAEPYVEDRTNYTGSFVVPRDKYLVLGDNRGDSLDARFWKNPFISEKQILYEVVFKVYPFKDMEKLT